MNIKTKHILWMLTMALWTTVVSAQNETGSLKHFAVKMYGGYSISNETSMLQVVGGKFDVENSSIGGVSVCWYYNKYWSAEFSVSTGKYKIGMVDGDYSSIDLYRYNLELGNIWITPLGLSARYNLAFSNKIVPYALVGATYLLYTNVDPGWAAKEITYTNVPAINFGIGADYNLNDCWFVNLEVRKFFADRSNVHIDFTNSIEWSLDTQLQPQPLNVTVGLGFRF